MNNPFEETDKEALSKFIVRKSKYGDSWETMPIYQLQRRLQEECAEVLEGRDLQQIHVEAIDVINIARMLAERTKEGKR